MENGVVPPNYDWYQFFRLGIKSMLIVYPFFMAFSFLLSFSLWKLNRR
jgi:hypothetical protein